MLRQVQNTEYKELSMRSSILRIYSTQGVSGIFKGNTAAVIRVFPFAACEFYFYELFKNLIIRGNSKRHNSNFYNFLCGGLTGLTAATLTFPLDVARTRLGVTTLNSEIKENKLSSALINLWKNDGIKGLYKGYTVASFVFSYFYNYSGKFIFRCY
jgi:hypothetical protein